MTRIVRHQASHASMDIPSTSAAPSPYPPPVGYAQLPPTNGPPDGYAHAQPVAAAALSQQQTSTPSPEAAAGNARKRRASQPPGATSKGRGVANLNPEQLAKKRANDREAQRAIRERTKAQIEGLERRIKELESQQPFQELQRAVRERDEALFECEQLRERLNKVIGIASDGGPVHPGLNGMFTIDDLIDPTWLNGSRTELAALTAQQSPLPTAQQPYQSAQAGAPYENGLLHPDLRSPTGSQTSPANKIAGPIYANGEDALRKWSPSNEHAQYQQSPNGGLHDQQQRAPVATMPNTNGGDRLGLNFLLDGTQHANAPAGNVQSLDSHRTPPALSPDLPMWARLPENQLPTCPLDSLLSDFIADCQSRLRNGSTKQEILGPEYPNFGALLDTSISPRRLCHPVSALLIDILSKFPDINPLAEKVGVLLIMFVVMRWFICPCAPCYERLPEWVRPIAEQLERPHATWVDNVPWYVDDPFEMLNPVTRELVALFVAAGFGGGRADTIYAHKTDFSRPQLRRRLITTGAPVKFEEFFVPFTTTLSLNWPYPNDQVLFINPTSDATAPGAVRINPLFETHLRDIRNWSLGSNFQSTFPDLVDQSIRIEDHRQQG